jgi:hypothetical protein
MESELTLSRSRVVPRCHGPPPRPVSRQGLPPGCRVSPNLYTKPSALMKRYYSKLPSDVTADIVYLLDRELSRPSSIDTKAWSEVLLLS